MTSTVRRMWVLDTPFTTLAETEHVLLGLRGHDLPDATVSTHEVRGDHPHYAFGISAGAASDVRGTVDVLEGLGCAVVERATSAYHAAVVDQVSALDRGRAVLFPGWHLLSGTLEVADVLAWSAIDRVRALGNGAVTPSDQVLTRDFVRPRWYGRELVLDVLPHAGGVLAPFEVPDPTPCCAVHV